MDSTVKLYSENSEELCDFLEKFFSIKFKLNNKNYWEKRYLNPIEMADIVAVFVDNKDKYRNTNMWVSIDSGVFINIKEDNYNFFIQYLFERYPY
ncbi:MAG: hypothetical protein J6K42_02455 [Clostridia bacterium]|nr:hypothetical protein [Clostridia bacterium]